MGPRGITKNTRGDAGDRAKAMIDRVTLRYGVPSADAVLDRLPPPTIETKPDGSTLWKGELGPFGYWLTEKRLTLRGCLAVSASGVAPSKVASLAAERLSDALGLDMGAARITTMEVFADLRLAKPVCLYLPLLWALGRHKRLSVFDAERAGETLKFITKRRCLQFYDKG